MYLTLNSSMQQPFATAAVARERATNLVRGHAYWKVAVAKVQQRVNAAGVTHAEGDAFCAIGLTKDGPIVGKYPDLLAFCQQEAEHFGATINDYLLCEIVEILEHAPSGKFK